jgi:hypothetical protein
VIFQSCLPTVFIAECVILRAHISLLWCGAASFCRPPYSCRRSASRCGWSSTCPLCCPSFTPRPTPGTTLDHCLEFFSKSRPAVSNDVAFSMVCRNLQGRSTSSDVDQGDLEQREAVSRLPSCALTPRQHLSPRRDHSSCISLSVFVDTTLRRVRCCTDSLTSAGA